jgi:hypothetical protein
MKCKHCGQSIDECKQETRRTDYDSVFHFSLTWDDLIFMQQAGIQLSRDEETRLASFIADDLLELNA